VLCGGKRPDNLPEGYYYLPTVLDCTTVNTPSVAHELFGPVLSVLTFDTEEEAVRLANDTEYGLGSGVFTQNLSRAHRMAAKIRAGVVWINTYRAISPLAPFGGFGLSGYGRESGAESILDYTRTKSVWLRTSDDPIPDPFVMR
jgi:acyl-CoA reductase-like NAD-dependent aldehyde dehydrogenase